ncbi:sigma-70 family RNA polymerase sigma factor [Gracilibacillus salitolerans]|uniref:Sigma-70 family RNA polymerase sigma factor n=1 Tax=Gracilibacillus salitolerans TaxID=2663022 RepID=A0A5Q2TJT4_9BACI|nr:RNA polymerase sigma factor [Gracilibacillus salitolerans]QGH34322.1 sigma-70 family RNA polymerase sigma factor [Gracilibacillus salitolerans]
MFTNDIYQSLVEQYQSMMHYTALKIVKDQQIAEDIVQETWIKVMKHQVDMETIDKLGAWLRTVTSRTAIDILRKEKRSHTCLLDNPYLLEELVICSSNEVDDQINWKSTLDELEQCINKSKKLKHVFQLKFKLELDDDQIAKTLNISHSAVKTRIFRARQLLKKHYQINDDYMLKPGA